MEKIFLDIDLKNCRRHPHCLNNIWWEMLGVWSLQSLHVSKYFLLRNRFDNSPACIQASFPRPINFRSENILGRNYLGRPQFSSWYWCEIWQGSSASPVHILDDEILGCAPWGRHFQMLISWYRSIKWRLRPIYDEKCANTKDSIRVSVYGDTTKLLAYA
jgi:hypothetical protein